jgi:hypothetical protein
MTIALGTRVKVAAGEHEGRYGTVINDRLDVMLDGSDGTSTHFDAEADLLPVVPRPSTQTTNQTIYYTA